jgi:hypothetical protein
MKRILVMLSIGILMLAACGNDKYVDKIDKQHTYHFRIRKYLHLFYQSV